MVLTEGQVLDGKYAIVGLLATGSMGEVYLGRHARIGKDVAIKVLRRDLAVEAAIADRFDREARIATAVKSTHVVDVYDLGDLPTGERYIVMEYVDGESLETRIAREGKLRERDAASIALQILDGLVAAHAAGVIHRDLKPANIILTKRDEQDVVKVVDFGISKLSEGTENRKPPAKTQTLHGMLLGTPMYMSPEQARGETDEVGARTDIFSLGVTMYEALSGEVPFEADNVVTLLSKVIDQEETPLGERVEGIDAALARIVKKAMAKDPADRFQTAAEMRQALADWQAMYGSTSVMRSSIDGVAARPTSERASFGIPTWIRFPLTLPIVRGSLRDKRARSAAVAAAVAVALTSAFMQKGSSPAAATTVSAAAMTIQAPDRIVVPTVPAIGDSPMYRAPLPREPLTSSPGTTTVPLPLPLPLPAATATPQAARWAKLPAKAPAKVPPSAAPIPTPTPIATVPAGGAADAGDAPPPDPPGVP